LTAEVLGKVYGNREAKMKPIKNQASSIAGLSALSVETKLCLGAAGGSAVIGAAGYAINALTTMETTLSAFLVISAFYLMLGVFNTFKSSPACQQILTATEHG
jgi:hypothetical protein